MHYSTLIIDLSRVQLEEGTNNDAIVGYFDEPCYMALSVLSVENSSKLLKDLMKVVCVKPTTLNGGILSCKGRYFCNE